MTLVPKNWNDFQHYRGRQPPWIKLHRKLLDDYEFACLPVASRALAPMLWLIASEADDGKIRLTSEALAFRLRLSKPELAQALTPLISKGFFAMEQDASNSLADRQQDACLETEVDTERERQVDLYTDRAPKRARNARELKPFPEGWQPDEKDLRFAADRGWQPEKIRTEFSRFRDHALANDRRQKDWPAAWRMWVTSPFQSKNGAGHGRPTLSDRAHELADQIRERERDAGLGRPPDPERSG